MKLINLPKVIDERGNLSFVEGFRHIPFPIKRAYWIYDVPGGESRGGHAFKTQHEFIIALSGSFDVTLDDGTCIKKFSLNRSYYGLYVPNGVWRSMDNFSTNAVALVLASTCYDENDYIREYALFKNFIQHDLSVMEFVDNPATPQYTHDSMCTTVHDCCVVNLDKNHRDKGNITVAEGQRSLPFDINRVYYLYDIPGGEERGGHAHQDLHQWLIAVSGAFDVELDDGINKQTITLNRPYQALRIVPGIWRELKNFSSGSICLVLASHHYDEKDYFRNYNDFLKSKKV